MKRTTSDLLGEYRHADFTKRLHLYLQYPELRPEFMEMDRKIPHPEAQGCMSGTKCTPNIPAGTLLSLKPGYVRRLFGMT
jgi:hypothetical protein